MSPVTRTAGSVRAILAAMLAGLAAGLALHGWAPARLVNPVADGAALLAECFLRLIRMLIAPLVLATLAGGIAGMRGSGDVRRIALLALAWFLAASLLSLLLGMLAANLLHPGLGFPVPRLHGPPPGLPAFDAHAFILHLVPASLADAMARNDIIQIVVFALLFGTAVASLPEAPAERLRTLLGDVAEAMLRLTALVMRLAPVAVFAALLSNFARSGVGLLGGYALFAGGFYATMLVLWAVLIGAGFVVLRRRVFVLLQRIAPQLLLGFATASSEAVFPQMLATLERFGVSPRLAGFVLPLGYAFNLDGAMLFQSFAGLFIAQAFGVALSLPQQLLMLLMLMATSKGTAGVPRAAIVALAAILPAFGLPDSGLLLLLGIDHLLDMGRTATSVLGNAIATAVVANRMAGEAMDRAVIASETA